MGEYQFIDDPQGLASLLEALRASDSIAVDTESDSLHVYFDKVSLFQFTADGQDYILDPLAFDDLSELGPIFASPEKEKIFHAAEYDILCLRRDYGFEFHGLFDTMITSQLLGYERCGLASLLSEFYDVQLDKRYQRAFWSQRPLTEPMLEYARMDTHHLHKLRDRLCGELEDAGRLHWAKEEFEWIAARDIAPRPFSPDDFRRIKGCHALSPQQQAILRELYIARDNRARELDRPAFKVISNATLLELARGGATTEKKMLDIPGITPLVMRRHGEILLDAVREGTLAEPPQRPPRRGPKKPYDARIKNREQSLRAWRKTRAADYRVEPHVILPNAVLVQLCPVKPISMEELGEVPGIRKWMVGEIGEDLVTFANKDLEQYL